MNFFLSENSLCKAVGQLSLRGHGGARSMHGVAVAVRFLDHRIEEDEVLRFTGECGHPTAIKEHYKVIWRIFLLCAISPGPLRKAGCFFPRTNGMDRDKSNLKCVNERLSTEIANGHMNLRQMLIQQLIFGISSRSVWVTSTYSKLRKLNPYLCIDHSVGERSFSNEFCTFLYPLWWEIA